MTANSIAQQLSKYRFASSTEMVLQDAIAAALSESGVPFTRERTVTCLNRLDFYSGATAIEVKISGSNSEVIRQLHRYAQQDSIEEILLITTRSKHRSIPPTLGGKPVEVLWIGGRV